MWLEITWRWNRFIFGFEFYDCETHIMADDTKVEFMFFIGFICIYLKLGEND